MHDHHAHAPGDRPAHGTIGLAGRHDAPSTGRLALGRRRFLAEMGRGVFAVAILGGSACSSTSGGGRSTSTDPATGGASGADPGAARTSTDGEPTTTAPASVVGSDPTVRTDPTAGSDPSADLRWAQVSLGFVSAYVLVRGNTAAVVDTGTSGSADQIGSTLATFGLTFDDVAHVVLTHHHPDHVGSLPEVLGRGPRAVPYAGAADIAGISSPIEVTAVGDGDDVFGLQVIETPGHTPGSIAVLDPGIGLLVAGDALNGNDDGTAISGPNPDFSEDMATAEATVAKLAGFRFAAAAFGHGQPVLSGASALVAELLAG